ncbi:hypothetical protein UPYG_G00308280 [Umbra pygmaea]|uniref:Cytochrome c oxidase copper chaperone n=1 Tax=Umbra pygmaea TaxID=75934 RepID=A0ABD0VZ45_UMBPY
MTRNYSFYCCIIRKDGKHTVVIGVPVLEGFDLVNTLKNMSSVSAASIEPVAIEGTQQKKPLKPCCACPETKKVRDTCIIEKGEESCTDLIEAHKECMRALGFKI